MRGATRSPRLGSHHSSTAGPDHSRLGCSRGTRGTQHVIVPVAQIYCSEIGRMCHWLMREKAQVSGGIRARPPREATQSTPFSQEQKGVSRHEWLSARVRDWARGHSRPGMYHTPWLQVGRRVFSINHTVHTSSPGTRTPCQLGKGEKVPESQLPSFS